MTISNTHLSERFEIVLSPAFGISHSWAVWSWTADNQWSKLSQQKFARKTAGVIFKFAVVLIWEEKEWSTFKCIKLHKMYLSQPLTVTDAMWIYFFHIYICWKHRIIKNCSHNHEISSSHFTRIYILSFCTEAII